MAYQRPGNLIPESLRWEVWGRDDFTCRSCGSRMYLAVDHVDPVAHGGATVLENLQTLCQPCNSRKSDHLVPFLRPGEVCTNGSCPCRRRQPAPSAVTNDGGGFDDDDIEIGLSLDA